MEKLLQMESALQKADLGCSPIIQENIIIISLPPMTEDNRINVIKKMNQKLEEIKVSIRNQREKIKEQIIKDEKDKIISEDDKFKRLEELDALVKNYNETEIVFPDRRKKYNIITYRRYKDSFRR